MKSICSFPGCSSGCAKERAYNKLQGIRNKSLFRFPKDKLLRNLWEQVINKQASDIDVLCELHFGENDLIRDFTAKTNENFQIVQRERLLLKPTAVPHEILDKENLQLINPKQNQSSVVIPRQKVLSTKIDNISCNSTSTHYQPTISDFTELLQQLNATKLPYGWAHTFLGQNNILVACYRDDCITKKKFLIKSDLSVKTWINDNDGWIPGITPVKSVSDIMHNINVYQQVSLCDGTGENLRYAEQCVGYIQKDKVHIRFGHNRCPPCQVLRKQIVEQKVRDHVKKKRKEEKLKVVQKNRSVSM